MKHLFLAALLLLVLSVVPVMRDSPDSAAEQTNILRWLSGDTNHGRWQDASPAWKHLGDGELVLNPGTSCKSSGT